MEKKVIYEKFNASTGTWDEGTITESEWLDEMRELDNEKEFIDAELEIVNKIIEQHLNNPDVTNELVESKD